MSNCRLLKVKSIAECSPWSTLQNFWPALSDNWSWKQMFGLFESSRVTQVLLYNFICKGQWCIKFVHFYIFTFITSFGYISAYCLHISSHNLI